MKRAITTLGTLACLSLASCGSARTSLTVSAVSGGVAVGGFAVAAGTDVDGGGFVLGVTATVIAVTTLVVGSLTEAKEKADLPKQQRLELERKGRERQTEAWALTKEATEAARHGDCTLVKQRDVIVRELDAVFHEVVFARDVSIRACLAKDASSEIRTVPSAPSEVRAGAAPAH